MFKKIVFVCAFVCFSFPVSLYNQTMQSELSDAEIVKKIHELRPKKSDLRFETPDGWSSNIMNDAKLISISDGETIDSVKKIIDGLPSTTWESNTYKPDMEIIIDLNSERQFNKLVVYNLFTDAQGTGGGNNATKQLAIFTSQKKDGHTFTLLDELELPGPRAVCFKRIGGGSMCTFIDEKEPEIFDLKEAKARYIKIRFKSAHWTDLAINKAGLSYALSEILLYQAP